MSRDELIDVGALPVWAIEGLLNCADACARDDAEPERYREWYANAAAELRKALPEARP